MGCKGKPVGSVHAAEDSLVEETIVDKEKLQEKGRIHYFYHSPTSKLPIRDVCNKQGKGWKTEPHIEIGAENYVGPCRPTNVIAHLNHDEEKYLFLVTTCRNKEMEEHAQPYIVGYIEKSVELITSDKRRALKGKLFLFPFEESVPYYSIFPHFAPIRLVDKKKTKEILDKFPDMEEEQRIAMLRTCVEEIKELDKKNKKERKTCLVLRGRDCPYRNKCLRWNPL